MPPVKREPDNEEVESHPRRRQKTEPTVINLTESESETASIILAPGVKPELQPKLLLGAFDA